MLWSNEISALLEKFPPRLKRTGGSWSELVNFPCFDGRSEYISTGPTELFLEMLSLQAVILPTSKMGSLLYIAPLTEVGRSSALCEFKEPLIVAWSSCEFHFFSYFKTPVFTIFPKTCSHPTVDAAVSYPPRYSPTYGVFAPLKLMTFEIYSVRRLFS